MSVFKFKQFTVDQSGCAMKINTDGVLLGALATAPVQGTALDIGTGTGVIALMLAQRFPALQIHALDIDPDAAATAARNFENSAFHHRLSAQAIAIEDFIATQKFDLIISNPPFFVNDLRNAAEKKGIARHAGTNFFQNLMDRVNQLLQPDGQFWFVLPVQQASQLIATGAAYGFAVLHQIELHSDVTKPAFRHIVCLSRTGLPTTTQHFYIYESEKVHTQAYQHLLKDFFLAY